MYISVESIDYHEYRHLLDQMFQLRKRVFHDNFGWDVEVKGDQERDKYDMLEPAYLLWCSDDMKTLFGSSRLLPTTGPTLLYDVFRDTFPADMDFCAPSIWEVTRTCIDHDAVREHGLGVTPTRALSQILLCLCEFGLEHRIETMITNYAPYIRRGIQASGARCEEVGCSTAFGKSPVFCGVFEISETVLAEMRAKMGVAKPLYRGFPERVEAQPTGSKARKGFDEVSRPFEAVLA